VTLPAAEATPTRAPVAIDPATLAPPFDWAALFGNGRPVEIEIGSGKGMFLKEAGRARPEVNFLGVERASRFYRTAVERVTRAGLANVRLLRADGLDVLDRWVVPGSIGALHVYFPDPWPKKRHLKRRISRPAFHELAARALPPGADLCLATDHAEYGEAIRALFAATDSRFEPRDWPTDDPGRLPTNYALKWERAGRALWWARYRRRPG
jgi:tRNA (guanine-N7-)-methyltransferase